MEPFSTGSFLMRTEAIKSTAREVLARAYYTSRHYLTRLKGKVLILTYHRILPEEVLRQNPAVQAGMYVRSDVFESQIFFLKEHFSVLSFGELLNFWREKTLSAEKRYCVITFDDGWLDNYLYAFPILRRHEIPATIFLPTALIGTDQWFWPDKLTYFFKRCFSQSVAEERKESLRVLKNRYPWLKPLSGGQGEPDIDAIIEACKGQIPENIESLLGEGSRILGIDFPTERVLMHWGEVGEMSNHRISFGSHSCTHKIFTTLSIQEVQKEVTASLYTLRNKNINVLPVLAYPNGNYNREIIRQVRAAGYEAAVSTRFGFEGRWSTDCFELKRVGVHHDISSTLPLFSFHIAGGNQFLATSYE
jgi:peptidoglycan/xylan/chitin deacetylase (PgdA/CDA1 family)